MATSVRRDGRAARQGEGKGSAGQTGPGLLERDPRVVGPSDKIMLEIKRIGAPAGSIRNALTDFMAAEAVLLHPALLATGTPATASPPIDRRARVGHVCVPIGWDLHNADAGAIGARNGGRSIEPVPGRGMPRPDRRPRRRRPSRVPEGACRDRARRGGLHRQRAPPWYRAVAFRRHSRLDQGPVRCRRRRHHVGLGGVARCAARRGRCAGGGAPARRRPDPDRPHQHDGVRVHRPRHQSALRHAAQSL